MKNLIVAFLMLAGTAMQAQQVLNDKVNIISGGGVYNVNAVIYTPAGYTPTKKYPLVIYAHGMGEAGTDINLLYNAGLPKVLKAGYKPSFDFVMVAPQRSSYSVDPAWLKGILEDCFKRYSLDSSRVYLTGISAGGWTVYGSELNFDTVLAKRFAAIIPLSGATQDAVKTNFDSWKVTRTPLWAVVGALDISYRDQNQFMVDEVNKRVPGLASITIRPGIGHGNWEDIYSGLVLNGTKNVWDWMYQYTRGISTPVVTVPVTPGHNFTLLPTSGNEIYRPTGVGLETVLPGDTINIPAGNYSLIDLGNFRGAAGKPIIIRNKGGLVTVGLMRFEGNAEYFKLLGNGDPGYAYGIKVSSTSIGIVASIANNFEIGYCETTGGDVGIMIKKNPVLGDATSQYPNYLINNVYIHNNYIHDCGGEGMYIGHTYPNADPFNNNLIPLRMDNVEIAYNTVTNSGWDGIQLSNARTNANIHHNTINNYGAANKGSQQAGIILGGNTNGQVHDNTINGGTGNGIQLFGYGTIKVFNNTIINAGKDGTAKGQESIFSNDYVTSPEVNGAQQLVITNNIIRNPAPLGAIRIGAYNNNSLPATVQNNQFAISNAPANWNTLYIISNVPTTNSGNVLIP